MLDSDLAELYDVETKALVQAVKGGYDHAVTKCYRIKEKHPISAARLH